MWAGRGLKIEIHVRKTEYLTKERPIQYEPNTSMVYFKSNDQRKKNRLSNLKFSHQLLGHFGILVRGGIGALVAGVAGGSRPRRVASSPERRRRVPSRHRVHHVRALHLHHSALLFTHSLVGFHKILFRLV